MRRAGIVATVLSLAMAGSAAVNAQDKKDAKKDAPAAATPAATPAQGKLPPQAKTQPEFDAYKAVTAITDPAAFEKGADDFAQKYPESEIRILLYLQAMSTYQQANNAEKMADMGRKVLTLDGDRPEALLDVAQFLAERTRDTDLDKDQKRAEGIKLAEKAVKTIDTDLVLPAGTPQDKVDLYKNQLRSTAYYLLGTIYLNQDTKESYPKAEENLRKSLETLPSQPDPLTYFRLAIAQDKQGKYTDALEAATKAVGLAQAGTPVGDAARREQDRLQKLTANSIH
jgi:tetratricopeptide (TPR) repeat protein